MIRNFFTIAFRNLFKHKIFSAINIFGLAIGIAACLLILQYVRFELSYDKFEQHAGRIYRLQQDRYNDGKLSTQWAAGAAGVGPAITKELPEIESFVRLRDNGSIVSWNDRFFREDKIYYADAGFLPMFGYRALEGDAGSALKELNTAAITQSTARKYFGSENPMGKTISLDKKENFKITAILADPPVNTHLKFDILLSYSTFTKRSNGEAENTFDWDGFYTYILVKPGTNQALLEKKIAGVIQKVHGVDLKERNEGLVYKLQPLSDIHLYSHYMAEAGPNGDGKSVYFLLIIALFIIVIAWINYINLSTARSIDRAREVGIRKVLGSYRRQLIAQFLFESLLVNLLAVTLAFLLVISCLPLFNSLTGKEISFSLLQDSRFWLALTALFVTGTLLAGLYPAFALSSFKPISVLKGKLAKTGHGAFLRQSLVIIQFSASVILMVGTFAVYRQLNFMQKQDLGVQIDQTLVLRGPNVIDSTYSDKLSAFKTEMLKSPGVASMSASTEVPGSKVGWNAGGIRLIGSDPHKSNQYRILGIDYDFLNVYGLKMRKGRNFSRQFSTDPKTVLLNEAAVSLMGFSKPEEALNKQIEFWGDQYTIIGVVSNHHQESLHQAYDAHIFRLIPSANRYYSLKLHMDKNRLSEAVQSAEKLWGSYFPGNPFEYFFMDEHFAAQYKADQQFGNTFGLFAILAIFVSCLGLLGLASFVTTQRTKEIGVRKIVGAGIPNILLLLTKDFLRPVLISFLIAIPLTYYLLGQWLGSFAFKISLDVWMFILPALLILAIALATISSQTIRAASANPVKSLRSE
jgi:putative ABC transport system permease protein